MYYDRRGLFQISTVKKQKRILLLRYERRKITEIFESEEKYICNKRVLKFFQFHSEPLKLERRASYPIESNHTRLFRYINKS